MAIYDCRCDKCGKTVEILQLGEEKSPVCCERAMRKLMSTPALIKIQGTGGTPIRSKGYKEGYSAEYLKDIQT